MMEQLFPAIISALFLVVFITILIYASEIPEKEENYRNSKEFKKIYPNEYEQETRHEDG